MNTKAEHPKYKRKHLNVKVKGEFQRWLLWRIFGVVLLSALVAALVLYFYARHETISTFYDAHIKLRRVSDLLLPVVLSGVGVSLLGGVALALFLPQKIAGPLYNIERTLERVRAGSLLPRVKLRSNDCLEGMAGEVNRTLDFMHKEVENTRELQQQIRSALDAGDTTCAYELLQRQDEMLQRLLDAEE
ncbi:MAG: methyl-accepting chemotaxis protein [Geobacteraceae bacterium]|nr:methyl-accepting chemotaxis protein [Geobacteraceae bacterium]